MSIASNLLDALGLVTTYSNADCSSYSAIETAIDAIPFQSRHGNVVLAKDGSLYSIISFRGARVMMGDRELEALIGKMIDKLTSSMSKPGHAIEFNFSRNPDGSKAMVANLLKTQENVAKNLGLNLNYAFKEQKTFLPRWLMREDIHIVMWTRPSVLSHDEVKAEVEAKEDAVSEARAKGDLWSYLLPQAPDTQRLMKYSNRLMQRHKAFVESFLSVSPALEMNLLTAHDAMRAVYNSLYPDRTEGKWRAFLQSDTQGIHNAKTSKANVTAWMRATAEDDLSAVLAPRMDSQLFSEDVEWVDSSICRIGGNYFATVDLDTPALDIYPFPFLLTNVMRQDNDGEFPWRLSCKIESGGMGRTMIQNALAGILSITTPNGYNRNIKKSLTYLRQASEAGACNVRMRMSFTTWSPVGDGRKKIDTRALSLAKAVESWGNAQVTNASGSPISSTMGTVMGLNMASTAPAGVCPLFDILYMMAWTRDVSPWHYDGSMLLRTDDHRPFNVALGTDIQTAYNYLIIGPPGKGKSFFLATLNYTSCLSPRMTSGFGGFKMPYVRAIDIGHSQTGTCRCVREALPPELHYLVTHKTMKMDKSCAINLMDTPLGCREPLPLDVNAIKNVLCVIATSEEGRLPSHMADMIAEIISSVYRRYSDKEMADAAPKKYSPDTRPDVHRALIDYGVDVSDCQNWFWWDVVDILALDHKDYHMASIAQRYAVPKFSDLISFTTESINRQYGKVMVEETQISLLKSFQMRLQSAVNEFPILAAPTAFDLRDSPFAVLDIKDICSSGMSPVAYKQNAIMFMLARYALSGEFYCKLDEIGFFNKDYYAYHFARVQRLESVVKIMEYDEFHRTHGVMMMQEQIVRDFREGRKYNIMNILASQSSEDYSDDMYKFANGTIIAGSDDEDERKLLIKKLALSTQAIYFLENGLNGPCDDGSGSPILMTLKMKDGLRHEHYLKNTPGPLMAWAFSTTAEDTALRELLYRVMPQHDARLLLAKRFPRGSAKKEILRMTHERAEREGVDYAGANETEQGKLAQSAIEEIANSIYSMWLQMKPEGL